MRRPAGSDGIKPGMGIRRFAVRHLPEGEQPGGVRSVAGAPSATIRRANAVVSRRCR